MKISMKSSSFRFFLYVLAIGLLDAILIKIAFRHNLWTTIVDAICVDIYILIVLMGIEGMIALIGILKTKRKKL